jgi:hypothetical protein|nr:MAG TPA: antitoxin [Caudoviricetes sp.]
MQQITAHVENNGQGLYSVYIEEDMPFGVIGDGWTIEEAKADFLESYKSACEDHLESTGDDVQVPVVFVLDLTALLYHYKNYLSLAGLSRLTGINKAQLSQYVCGRRNAKPQTIEHIKKAVQDFARDLLNDFA